MTLASVPYQEVSAHGAPAATGKEMNENGEQEGAMTTRLISKLVGVLTAAMITTALATGPGAWAGTPALVDVNRASVAELTTLPGIGPAKAAAIVEEREREPFRSVTDLSRVSGIGERSLEQLRDRISVGNVNAGTRN